LNIPNIGCVPPEAGCLPLERCSDGLHAVGRDGVVSITATGDRRVEFIAFRDHTLAYVNSALGYPAYYPVQAVRIARPVRAVLMDLDGTSVRSEAFWVWIIQQTVGALLGDPGFALDETDFPHVSGHSISEHLQYCIDKYCPGRSLAEARRLYFENTRREMSEILAGRGRADTFTPAPGLKPFLLALKQRGIRIGLVTSGLHEKAWPAIVSAFRTMDLGDPAAFYDAIITAGSIPGKGAPGNLGELALKPHPWLYAEAACVGLQIPARERHHVIGIEDSGAGVCAIRLAGFAVIGLAGGNLIESGTRFLCSHYCQSFDEILEVIETRG
jgi:beta-phosphoglucomutase-like phosphatase (HAD superfamily)